MLQVPDLESFNKLVARVDRVESENSFLKTLLLGQGWLNRTQAMKALGCGHNKLRQLHNNQVLTYRYEGDRPFYDAFSIRTYLTAQKINVEDAEKRVLTAFVTA